MSSRAIIARCIENGFFTSWCWINGDPENIGEILRTYFTTDDMVEELISFKSILGVFKDPADDTNKYITGSFTRLSNGLYVKYDDGKNTVISGGLNGFFPTLSIMMKEEVQYIYIFDAHVWKTYRLDNVSDQIVKKKTKTDDSKSEDKKAEDHPVRIRGRIKKRVQDRHEKTVRVLKEIKQGKNER